MSETTPIFITARFRTGSTMLWKFFRSIPRTTAYYEPLHQELLQGVRFGFRIQERHYGVTDYFEEYKKLERLPELWSPSFSRYRLYLKENDKYEALQTYIDYLIRSSVDIPVFKFNRIDFRLPWIRRNFPHARIIHLYRNVRDQWLSSLDMYPGNIDNNPDANPSELKTWCDDLTSVFPFLALDRITHSYQRYYFLWKLSYLFGAQFSDASISYENWIGNPRSIMTGLLLKINIQADIDKLLKENPVIIKPQKTISFQKPPEWYQEHEDFCEKVLCQYGLSDAFVQQNFEEIRSTNTHYKNELLNSCAGHLRQLEYLHRESNQRLTQIYEKEKVIYELKKEIEMLRSVTEERLKVIQTLDEALKAQAQLINEKKTI